MPKYSSFFSNLSTNLDNYKPQVSYHDHDPLPFLVSTVSTVSTLSKIKNLGVRGNYAFPQPSLQFLSIFVNVNDMIYGIYGKLGTLLIIKNHTQNFTDIGRNPFYVSAVSTSSA